MMYGMYVCEMNSCPARGAQALLNSHVTQHSFGSPDFRTLVDTFVVLEDIAHYFTASYSGLNQPTLY